ncbi:isocitrate lyase/phosphoenolpyruvate mutase family protein [Arthrobacter sp. NamB2]|uniref:isocitrate lyase/PEP mutase family protein n=1 Tax=Arthrobacter sp. NamB2 TaxID=2576035 RepID=UPI0010C9C650|nr:isocitrate lyase/phosphoenolpyruvate mutase family protein [Arthrobacter sp. NamB2]TKV28948.1 isocitrate lyase/phosphoenolpyruvate mutase family protein [Arthrobacter sp. NamB2]
MTEAPTSTDRSDIAAKATTLAGLHAAPEILQVVNVWDVISAKTIADIPGTKALATASHSIAASLGYEDGENIPVEEMVAAVGRIAAATTLPVTADLESGYGNPGETVRRAIGVGIVGANIEDQMRPLADAVDQMEAVLRAGRSEGVDFVLNARTDAFVKAGDRDPDDVLADAVERGKAYLAVGATNVFVPGLLDEHAVTTLVSAFGPQRLSVINVPGSLAPARLQELGVARISYGPWTQRVALTALATSARELLSGGALPEGTLPLN